MSTPKPPRMNRADRMAEAQARVNAIEPEFRRLEKVYVEAHRAFRRAEESFDVEERVHVEEWGSRRRIEREYDGVVVAYDPGSDSYSVRRESDGTVFDRICSSEMMRIKE